MVETSQWDSWHNPDNQSKSEVTAELNFQLSMIFQSIMLATGPSAWSVVFGNGPGDQGSFPGRVIPKTEKMVRDAPLLTTQHYKVGMKGKVKKSR